MPRDGSPGTCGSCGGQERVRPGEATLRCQHCGAATALDVAPVGTLPMVPAVALAQRAAEDTGPAAEDTARCTACGARTELFGGLVQTTCPWCAGALVADSAAEPEFAPVALLPFRITEAEARRRIADVLAAQRRFGRAAARPLSLHPVYLPFWAMRGHAQGVAVIRHMTLGQRRPETTRLEVDRPVAPLLVPAARDVATLYGSALVAWSLEEAVAYDPRWLLGGLAERPTAEPAGILATSEGAIVDRAIAETLRLGGKPGAATERHIAVGDMEGTLVMAPLWISLFRQGAEVFPIAVNGQTGVVGGRRPVPRYSAWLGFVAGFGAIILAALLLGRPFEPPPEPGPIDLIPAPALP